MGSKAGVRKRPTVEREKLYRLVLELRRQGLSYGQIIKHVESERGVRLAKSHISGWINGKHKPFGYVRAFDPKPSAELAYVIGVKMGDAWTSTNKTYNYMIKLRVIDKEFAVEFARCLSVILARTPPHANWSEKKKAWNVCVSSLLLQNFLRKSIDDLKLTIEHDEASTSAFLRGFFDSEGWVYQTQLGVANTNYIVLDYVSKLLETRFGIRTYGPKVTSRGGRKVMIKGQQYRANKDCYSLLVDKSSLLAFQSRIGFTILRKKQRLAVAVATVART